jgi:hypothetical protein
MRIESKVYRTDEERIVGQAMDRLRYQVMMAAEASAMDARHLDPFKRLVKSISYDTQRAIVQNLE